MRRHAVWSGTIALGLLLGFANRSEAQGFGVYEHDACVMGRAGTGVASPCAPSASAYFNPAGILAPGTSRWNAQVGLTAISPSFTYRDSVTGEALDGTSNTIPVPNLYVSRQMSDKWALGLGVFAPYGLVSEWPTSFSGRFLAYRSDLKSIYIQPTVAFRVRSWLTVGAGFDYIRSVVKLNQRVDLSAQPTTTAGVTFANLGIPKETDFADAELHGTSWSAGANLGILIRPNDRLSVGVRYQMKSTADLQGDATFTQIQTGILLPAGNPLGAGNGASLDSILAPQFTTTLAKQHASVRVPLPDQLVIGAAVQATSRLLLLADFQLVRWSRFKELKLSFANLPTRTLWEDYEDTRAYRFGAEFRASQRLDVRIGGLYHEAAAPDQTVTPLLPEAERSEFTAGLTWRFSGRARLDVAYQKIWQADRRGRVVEPPVRGPAGTSVNTGIYGGGGNLFGASVAWGF